MKVKVLFRGHAEVDSARLHQTAEFRKNLLVGNLVRYEVLKLIVATGLREVRYHPPELGICVSIRQRVGGVYTLLRNAEQSGRADER